MSTENTTEQAATEGCAAVDLFAGLDDLEDDIWCIERADNPDIALCGNRLAGPIIPT